MSETSEWTPEQIEWDQLFFSVKRSERYHTRRRCFFERIGFITSFLTVFGGGGTGITALVGASAPITAIFGFVTAALSSADLIIGYTAKGRQYHDLARRYIQLQMEMISVGTNPTETDLIKFKNKRLEIEADEPPKLCLLDVICHNEVIRALGRDEDNMMRIPFWKGLLCQFYGFDPTTLKRLGASQKSGTPNQIRTAPAAARSEEE